MGRFPRVVEGWTTRIHLCGRLIVELSGRRLEESLRGRQGRLLLAYLTLNRDRPVRRDELAEALWSGKGAPPAYESLLAPPLSRLRKTLGAGVLEGRSELQLILPDDAWVDWEAVPRELRRAREASDPKIGWEAAQAAQRRREQRLVGRGRALARPQRLGELVAADRPVSVQREVGEQEASLSPAQRVFEPPSLELHDESTAQLDAGRFPHDHARNLSGSTVVCIILEPF